MTRVMIPHGWLGAELVKDDGDVLVTAYRDTENWFGVVFPNESITVPVTSDDDIAIDPNTAELVLGAGQDQQQRMDLAELLWAT